MSADALFDLARKTSEAQAVRLGLPVPRQFSDAEIADSVQALADIEREMYGEDPRNEGVPLSAPELQLLNELNRKMIAFRVSVTTETETTQINVLASHSINALLIVADDLLREVFDDEPMRSFKISVTPVAAAEMKRAA